MAHERNISITSAGTAGVRLTFCTTSYTGSFSCTSYPVFSSATTDGTSYYAANTPLKQLSPAGSFAAANSPAVSYSQASGTALITFGYGTAFSSVLQEYESGASPRRYRYILHTSGHTPATAYASSVSASTAVVAFGSVNLQISGTTTTPVISVCSDAVEGSAGGGL